LHFHGTLVDALDELTPPPCIETPHNALNLLNHGVFQDRDTPKVKGNCLVDVSPVLTANEENAPDLFTSSHKGHKALKMPPPNPSVHSLNLSLDLFIISCLSSTAHDCFQNHGVIVFRFEPIVPGSMIVLTEYRPSLQEFAKRLTAHEFGKHRKGDLDFLHQTSVLLGKFFRIFIYHTERDPRVVENFANIGA
jgi:hypothetical protein